MFSWSLIGTAIAISLFLISVFFKFIYGLNLFYKYSYINSSIKHRALVSAKEITNKNKPTFRVRESFFIPITDSYNNSINFSVRTTMNNTIFDQVTAIFNAYLFNLNANSKINISLFKKTSNIIMFIVSLNIIWLLIFGLWIPATILFSCLVILMVIHLLIEQKNINKAILFTKEYLKVNEDAKKLKDAFAYLKYKKMSVITKYSKVFVEPLHSLVIGFKKWGKNE